MWPGPFRLALRPSKRKGARPFGQRHSGRRPRTDLACLVGYWRRQGLASQGWRIKKPRSPQRTAPIVRKKQVISRVSPFAVAQAPRPSCDQPNGRIFPIGLRGRALSRYCGKKWRWAVVFCRWPALFGGPWSGHGRQKRRQCCARIGALGKKRFAQSKWSGRLCHLCAGRVGQQDRRFVPR